MTRINQPRANYSTPEPMPKSNDSQSIHDLVIQDIADRKEFGFSKYGTLLQPCNGRKTAVDLHQELLDAVCYSRSLIEEQNAIIKALLLVVQQNMKLEDNENLVFHWHLSANESAIDLLESLGYLKLAEMPGDFYKFTCKAIDLMES